MNYFKIFVIIFLLGSFFLMPGKKIDPAIQQGLNTIRWQDVYDYCRILSSDRFAGRYTGTPTYDAMAKWVASKFKGWGLLPINNKQGYLQTFPSPYTIVDKAEMTVFIAEKEPEKSDDYFSEEPVKETETKFTEKKLAIETDFFPFISTGSGDVTGELVFVGWGISAPDLGYDDYAGIEAQNKIVLIFYGTPDFRDERYSDYRRKVSETAKGKGAVGLISIGGPTGYPYSENWLDGMVTAMISEEIADLILAQRNMKVADLKKDLETYKRPLSFPLKSKVHLSASSRRVAKGIGYNVFGYLEGSDEKLKKECIIIGAHVDHLGKIVDRLFPGADDNASGSAVVMEIAQAFAGMGKRPKRSVAFALFGGEEISILGSKYMSGNIPKQFSRVDLMINFDMVGEGDGARASVSTKPDELKGFVEEADKYVKILRREVRRSDPKRIGGTDHTAFYVNLKCPVASFMSNGPHLAYHKPGDNIFRVNPDMMAEIAKIAYLTATTWADR